MFNGPALYLSVTTDQMMKVLNTDTQTQIHLKIHKRLVTQAALYFCVSVSSVSLLAAMITVCAGQRTQFTFVFPEPQPRDGDEDSSKKLKEFDYHAA